MRLERVKKTWEAQLKSDYYLVFINPDLHKKDWNTLKLLLTIAQANYLVFHDTEIEVMQLHPVDKHEYKYYQYNPN
jgi:hypothetical protein